MTPEAIRIKIAESKSVCLEVQYQFSQDMPWSTCTRHNQDEEMEARKSLAWYEANHTDKAWRLVRITIATTTEELMKKELITIQVPVEISYETEVGRASAIAGCVRAFQVDLMGGGEAGRYTAQNAAEANERKPNDPKPNHDHK